jgi:chemotaxis protein MotD
MTEAVGGAAQSQSMIEAVTQSASAKAGAHAHRANAKTAHETRQADDDEPARETDHPAKETRRNDDTSDHPSVKKTGNSSRQSHRDDKKDDDKDKSFEATFDKLGPQSASTNANATQNANPNALQAVWSAEVAFKQFASGRLSDAKAVDVAAVSANSKGATRPASLLKQESVAALLDAKTKLLSAQDAKDSVAADASDTTTVSPVVVQSRESHWIFGNGPATMTNPRVSDATSEKDIKANPLTALTLASSTKGQDAASKAPTADATASTETPQVAPADSATPRQTFDGQHGGGTSGRDQTSGNAVDRRVPDVPASKSADHVSPDLADVSNGTPGPTQQIRNGVLDALSGDAKTTPTTSQIIQGRPVAVPGQVLRTIDITLSPENLGTVRVRLSLKSNSLEIDAEASKASTAKLLNDDRKGLEQSLRDAGYDVSSLKIADVASGNNAGLNSSLNGGGSSFQDGGQARANFAGRQDGNMQGRNGATPDQSQQQQSRNNNPKGSPGPEMAKARRSNEIYI